MATNIELLEAIAAMSTELEKDAPETEGKNNSELAKILSGLKAEKKAADELKAEAEAKAAKEAAEAEAKAAKEAAEAEAKAAKEAKPPFFVMPGKCLTSKRGILADGDEIKAGDLSGGAEALNAFVKSGHVGKA